MPRKSSRSRSPSSSRDRDRERDSSPPPARNRSSSPRRGRKSDVSPPRRRSRDREREKERERGKDRERSRDRDKEKNKRRRSSRSKEKEKEKDKRDRETKNDDKDNNKDNKEKEKEDKDKLNPVPMASSISSEFREFQELLSQHTEEREKKRPVTTTPTAPPAPGTASSVSSLTAKHVGIGVKGSTPITVDELRTLALRAQAEEKGALKPVFQSKKQREEEALRRLEAQRAQEKGEEKMTEDHRRTFERAIDEKRRSKQNNMVARRLTKEEEEERDRRLNEKEKLNQEKDQQKQLQVIKENYLGSKKPKKRFIPPSQKFKFSFDWEAGDDTGVEIDPLYANKHNGALLFGRGFMGGMDRREQRKSASSKFYDELMENRDHLGMGLEQAKDVEKVKQRKEREKIKEEKKGLQGRRWNDKKLDEMEERDWRIFKEEFAIFTRGSAPLPIRSWAEGGLPEKMLMAISAAGYVNPTPIQRAAIPCGLRSQDVVGIAETGSGKTAAFLIPMIVYIANQPKLTPQLALEGPYAIVLAPTRELANQTSDEANKFTKHYGFKSVSIVGGIAIEDQGVALREGAEILIATPGRLFDCIERHYIVLNQCNYVVLDEADRMIDMNFEPQIIRIMDTMPSTNLRPAEESLEEVGKRYRITTMFSATMPVKVEMLSKKYLRRPVFIYIGDRQGKTGANIEQRVEWCPENNKKNRLQEILREDAKPPIIIFCNSKKSCDLLARWLEGEDFKATVIHGGKTQEQREINLKGFKDGTIDILVATDVVGRGIDIPGVNHVINYDLPNTIDKYTHRIGRTGRAGLKGVATSFLTDTDTEIMFDLRESLDKSHNIVPQELARHEASKQKPGEPGKPTLKRQGVIFAK